MLAAWRRSAKFRRRGVVAAGDRDQFYARCVKGTSPAFRAAFALFLEGKRSAAELSLVGVRSVSPRRGLPTFGVAGLGVVSALLVFLTFYFLVPIGETMLRTAVCAFHGAIATLSFRLLSYEYVARAEKAAARFSACLDGLLLRVKKVSAPMIGSIGTKPSGSVGGFEDSSRSREGEESPFSHPDARRGEGEKEDRDLADLKALLRELDCPPLL